MDTDSSTSRSARIANMCVFALTMSGLLIGLLSAGTLFSDSVEKLLERLLLP